MFESGFPGSIRDRTTHAPLWPDSYVLANKLSPGNIQIRQPTGNPLY